MGNSIPARFTPVLKEQFDKALEDHQIRGTITVFDGLRFDDENPYTYREGKRLLQLLGDLLRERKDLQDIGVDRHGKGRPAITGKGGDAVWDFLPLMIGRNRPFTEFPHLTMSIGRSHAIAAVTVPNGVKGRFRSRLASATVGGFRELIAELEHRVRPVVNRSASATPTIYVSQRHYRGQKSPAVTDARLEADLRTGVRGDNTDVKYQPQWIEAIFDILTNKRSNIQLGVEVRFRYSCEEIQSPKAADLFADAWKAFSPLIDFVSQH